MRTAPRKALRFTQLRLENWRNFAQVEADLQRRVFLIGPNACGKSNLLDVFRFLHDVASVGGGFQEAVRTRGGVSRLRCLAARRYSEIAIGVRVGEETSPAAWEYELRFNQDKQRRQFIELERVVRDGEEVLVRPDDDDKQDPARLGQTHLEQVNVNRDFRELVDFFASVRYLHIVPHLIRDPERSVGRTNDPFGGDFLEQVMGTNKRTREAWLRRIREALLVAVPQLKELELQRDEVRGTPHLRGNYQHWRPQGAWQTEEDFSDGTLRLLGLLWAILDGTGPLLLEEPELSLHPDVVRHIPQMFARAQRRTGRQVLVSTHSADLLNGEGIGLDEVWLLQPGHEGTSVLLASTFRDLEVLVARGLGVGEAVVPLTRPKHVEQLLLFGE